ncbi:MAG: hypothetical protein ACRD4Q_01210 [Candidatus Acidiferrales bacterium]
MKSAAADKKPEAPTSKPKGFKVRADAKADSSRHSLTLRLGDDGKPCWNKLSDATRDAWRNILRRPETATDLGFNPPEGTAAIPAPELVSEETVQAAYTVLGHLEAKLFARVYRVPPEVATGIFHYRDQELSLLTKPTQKVLSKYAPGLLAKYADEIGLALILASITQAKVSACSAIAAKLRAQEKAKQASTQKSNGEDHSPISENEWPQEATA